MELLHTSKVYKKSGFTLIEISLVLGLFLLIGSLSLAAFSSPVEKFVCRSEFELLGNSIVRARAVSHMTVDKKASLANDGRDYVVLVNSDFIVDRFSGSRQAEIIPEIKVDFFEGLVTSDNREFVLAVAGRNCSEKIKINEFGTF